jgi:uncharacterized SAM-binding protein YcdF (DUF218 family)
MLLVQPVALIGWALLLSLALLLRAPSSRRRALLAAGALALYGLFTTPLGANGLVRPLELRASREAVRCGDVSSGDPVIVVLAGGASAGAGSAERVEYLQEASYRRLLYGLRLAREKPASRVLISGSSLGGVPEVQLMAHLALMTGLAPGRLVLDGSSRNTAASARAVRTILSQHGPAALFLVTSAMHMPRALALFRAQGLDACARPTDFRFVPPGWPGYVIPQVSALDKSTDAVHEYLGLVALLPKILFSKH